MTEFKLPELGENVHQGDLVRLMVAPGATVAEGQPVMELETDKAVVEVPSSVSGTVRDVMVKQGEKIKVGQVIFTVENGRVGRTSPERESKGPPPAKSESTANIQVSKPESKHTTPTDPAPPQAASTPTAVVPSETAEIAEFKLPELGENIQQGDLVRL